MPERRWKRHEREIAEALGGKRIPITGRGTCDIEHPVFAPEVKSRKRLPDWLTDPLEQAVINASDGKLPMVIWVEGRQEGHREKPEPIVMLRLKDFREWYGKE